MINKVKANNINTIFYIGNKEQYNETCEYLNKHKWVWLQDGFYYYREPLREYPFLIFADNNKHMVNAKIFPQHRSDKFFITLLRQKKLERILTK